MTSPVEVTAGLLLIFLLPGFAVFRAVFPERRILRPFSSTGLVETLTASFIVSVALSILVGFVWLGTAPGVQAGWSQPYIELTLAGVSAIGLGVAALRGGFSATPPPGPALEPAGAEGDPMVVIRRLEGLHRTERTLRHELRIAGADPAERSRVTAALEEVRRDIAETKRTREAELARR